ncbi:MAG: glycoside hydrolase family 2, partial [Clostridiales bacterium]|nr:glycoside hydrolase family 2 [Clostridiales bacterium]
MSAKNIISKRALPNSRLFTRWGRAVDRENPLPEYPRPGFVRESFLNLNGVWEYAIYKNGAEFGGWQGEIVVPFSPESALSGVEKRVFPDDVLYYRRSFEVKKGFLRDKTVLHFGAVDDFCAVYLNGKAAGEHQGGFVPFDIDVTGLIKEGRNEIYLEVTDPTDTGFISRGKQSGKPGGIWYSAQSGIWQTVWLESLPAAHIESVRMTPDVDGGFLRIFPVVRANSENADGNSLKSTGNINKNSLNVGKNTEKADGNSRNSNENSSDTAQNTRKVKAVITDNGRVAAEADLIPNAENTVKLTDFTLWSPENPHLYDIEFTFCGDRVKSYFGMRKFSIGKDKDGIVRLTLNNKPYFHNGLLDQGYWPDGLLTAPSDDAMLSDIKKMKELGFNMLRKHIKIEPLRWYYHCDREGMIVWQDMINGGGEQKFSIIALLPFLGKKMKDTAENYEKFGRGNAESRESYYNELDKMISLLYNTVSIGVWVPFNEGWGQFDALRAVDFIRERDDGRVVDHASGWYDQGGGDLNSVHIYFKAIRTPKDGKRAAVLSEFGGYSHHVKGHVWNENRVFGYRIFKE